jgi:hypothetical protein
MTRLLLLIALGLLVAATLWEPGSGNAQERSEYVHTRYFRVTAYNGRSHKALAMFPRRIDRQDHPDGERYPLVVALHGRGEARRGPGRGYLGWRLDYGLPDAFGALDQDVVTKLAYRDFVTSEHLAAVNAELDERPFGGAMVVTPYVPDLASGTEGELSGYADWLAGSFLKQVREQFSAARGRASTGIDGVSLGGWVALETGLRHPDAFGAVGGIQPAVTGREGALARLAAKAEPVPRIRLLTSDKDPFETSTVELSRRLRARHVPHRLVVLPGPHGYEFNRGAGSMELLRFHERVLPREPL